MKAKPSIKRRLAAACAAAAAALAALLLFRAKPPDVEIITPVVRTVQEFIIEDATTRLANEYVVDMPISGTVTLAQGPNRRPWEIGDSVEKGVCLAQIDPFGLERQIAGVEALIRQAHAQAQGVDTAKPKPEDLDSASVRVKEMTEARAMAARERAAAEIECAQAKKQYERMKRLYENGVVSQAQYDEAERAFRTLEQHLERLKLAENVSARGVQIAELTRDRVTASVDDNEYLRDVYRAETEHLQSQLEMLKNDLEKTNVVASVSGCLLEKYVEGSRVLPVGAPLFKLGDLSDIEIESDVLSEEVVRIQVGAPVEISGKALHNRTIMGTVTRIYPAGFKKISALGIEQQRVKVIIQFDNSQWRLRPGTSLDVRIICAERADALAVPERAVFRYQDCWAVFVVKNGRARLRTVALGLKNDEWAEVTKGLEPDDSVVAEPKNELEDGMRVRVSRHPAPSR